MGTRGGLRALLDVALQAADQKLLHAQPVGLKVQPRGAQQGRVKP